MVERSVGLTSISRTLASCALVFLVGSACASLPRVTDGYCRIAGPLDLAPRKLGRLKKGMPKSEVDRLLGEPTYSPTEGQYYYPTGGECPLNDPPDQMLASCGLVADFRVINSDADPPSITVTGRLEDCWWGGVGE